MPPRTRRAANQENAVGAGPPASPMPISKKRKIATEPEPTPRPGRILQDITSRFIEPQPVVEGSKPTASKEGPQPPRRKRRAKAPIERLAKRKQLVDGRAHHPAIPSSLPPSSPPSESSRFDAVHQPFAGPRFTRNRSPSLEYADENADPFSDFEPSLGLLPEATSSNQADPFGFLAVESRLKAKREAAQPFRVLTDLDLPVDDDHPTPHPDTFEDDNDENVVPLGVPTTPHKRRKHRKSMMTSTSNSAALYNPSPQSTPSPSKPRRSLARGNQSPADSSESELVLSRPPIASAARTAQTSADAQKAKSRKEARAPKKSLTPRTLGKSLEALLPKRTSRTRVASSKGKGKRAREAVSDDEEDEPSPRKMKKRATVAKKPSSTAKGKAKATEADDEEIDIDDAQEKLKQERQARLDYFKKLDSYKVEEENVYVV